MFWKDYKNLPRNVWALSLVSLLNDTSSEIIYPLLPTFLALTLGASPFAIGAIEGIPVEDPLVILSPYLRVQQKEQIRKVSEGIKIIEANM